MEELFAPRLLEIGFSSLSTTAAALIVVASEVIGMAAALSRPSTLTDAAGELAELVAISSAAAVLHYLDRLIAMADAEMYRSKKGMNRVSVFDDP